MRTHRVHRVAAPILGLAALLAAFVPAASAYEVPNLVALASPDMQVAVAYAATPDPTTVANAGAFASTLSQQFGMVPIANFDPTTNGDSELVCEAPINADELVVIYGIQGQGIYEAAAVCQYFAEDGASVRWR
jgi:hypothetical protein